jgi:hypothetical protein
MQRTWVEVSLARRHARRLRRRKNVTDPARPSCELDRRMLPRNDSREESACPGAENSTQRFVAAFGSGGFESETVFRLGDFAAVAIWLPPGAEADAGAIVAVLSESVPAEWQADAFSVLEQMDAAHPKDLHWYLPWLGVDSARLASEGSYSSSVWPAWTRIICRRFSKRRTRGLCRSMSATDSS